MRDEHEKLGFRGRFGVGLPRINNGSFLFLQHLISKMRPAESGGSLLAITVERPLRLRGRGRAGAARRIEDVRESLAGLSTPDRAEALAAAAAANGKLSKAEEKALLEALAVRDPDSPAVLARDGAPEPDPSSRLASEPDRRAVEEYMAAEVLPYVPDAWVDHTKTRIGYEIPLTRHFYRYVPPRPLEEIDAEIRVLEEEIQELLREVAAPTRRDCT